nr:integral membrane protein GPR137 isoform X1 [Oryctolagus cuniculus]XP_051689063.1 integral membrane protein GPR137 isoform X1 [Oryctolagus cuniculus]
MESNLSGLVPAAGLVPALPPAVTLGLTAAYTTLYALLFFSVYAQLWLVLLYGHKRLSYQTVFLALCLLWAALRTTLFSFYFRDTPRANRLGPLPFWLLYCCPVCLQFFTLTLMNLYFAQVVFKAKAKRRPEMSRGLLAVRGAFVGASLLFLLVNVLCAVLSRRRRAQPWALLLVRVLVSDSLFVICALSLAACLCLVARRAPSTSIYLEAKGTSVCQAAAMGGAMVLLYASRACYNLAALALAPRSRLDAFDYDWYNVSDQADLVNDLGNKGYLVFGLILFVWELLPTTLLVGFFRVHRPPQDLSASRILNGQGFGSRSYFFDRAGQCEDEGCSWEHSQAESTRCRDPAATTTASTPPHRRDSPPPPPGYPAPPPPGPCAKFTCRFLPRIPGPGPPTPSGRLLAAPTVVSLCHPPRTGGTALAARCPQRPGMTGTSASVRSQLPLLCCHSIKCLCPHRFPLSVLCPGSPHLIPRCGLAGSRGEACSPGGKGCPERLASRSSPGPRLPRLTPGPPAGPPLVIPGPLYVIAPRIGRLPYRHPHAGLRVPGLVQDLQRSRWRGG